METSRRGVRRRAWLKRAKPALQPNVSVVTRPRRLAEKTSAASVWLRHAARDGRSHRDWALAVLSWTARRATLESYALVAVGHQCRSIRWWSVAAAPATAALVGIAARAGTVALEAEEAGAEEAEEAVAEGAEEAEAVDANLRMTPTL